MAGKKSILKSLTDALVESDEKETAAPAPAAAIQPTPGMAMAFGLPTTPVSTAPVVAAPAAPSTADIDPEALQTVKTAVYAANVAGRPSKFILFLNMWERLGRPADPNMAIGALNVTIPDLTTQTVVADLDQHTILLDNTAAAAKQTFDTISTQRLGGNDAEIDQLLAADKAADDEIARHTREKAERSARLTALTTERSETGAKLDRARARTTAAEALVRTELTTMKQILSR